MVKDNKYIKQVRKDLNEQLKLILTKNELDCKKLKATLKKLNSSKPQKTFREPDYTKNYSSNIKNKQDPTDYRFNYD
jgi:hypothetical protein